MTGVLLGSDFTDGARLPNYRNGRVLVAEDLAEGQVTLAERDRLIGQAAGTGVVRGLWVTSATTALRVAEGLALSPSGAPVRLGAPITLPLSRPLETSGGARATARFACCAPRTDEGVTAALRGGTYLLTARPACRLDGGIASTAAGSGNGGTDGGLGDGAPPGCVARWRVEGVEFSAVTLDLPARLAGTALTPGNRRNLLAHWCYGTGRLWRLAVNPFGFDPSYRGLARLGADDLGPHDVPLAVFGWDGSRVVDLDNWSVRRPPMPPDAVPEAVPSGWAAIAGRAPETEGRVRLLQFQDQVKDLMAAGQNLTRPAATWFGYLPPVGFLPIALPKPAQQTSDPPRTLADHTAQAPELVGGSGFDADVFFGGLGRLVSPVPWAGIETALAQSWRADPVSTRVRAHDADQEPLLRYALVQEHWTDQLVGLNPDPQQRPWRGVYVVFLVDPRRAAAPPADRLLRSSPWLPRELRPTDPFEPNG